LFRFYIFFLISFYVSGCAVAKITTDATLGTKFNKKINNKDESISRQENKVNNTSMDFIANGYIRWSSKYGYPSLKLVKTLYMQNGKEENIKKMTLDEAKQYCESLNTVESLSYRVPEEEVFFRSDTSFIDSKVWTSTHQEGNVFRCGDANGTTTCDKSEENYVRCVIDPRDFNKTSWLSFAQERTVNMIRQKSAPVSIPEPMPTLHEQLTPLTKGEFESTKDFNLRVAEEEIRIDALNKTIDKNNKSKLLQWEKKVADQNKVNYSQTSLQDNNEIFLKNIEEAIHVKSGNPIIDSVTYNADQGYFDVILKSQRGGFVSKINIPVRLEHAQKFKEILTDRRFEPTVIFHFKNNQVKIIGIEQAKDPDLLVKEKMALESAYNSADLLDSFIKQNPHSIFIRDAQNQLLALEEQGSRVRQQSERDSELAKKNEVRERKSREAHYAKKSRGDKVCKSGNTAIILPITITAYVENINGDNIQLRIVDTEGTSPYYNGSTLYRDSIIWDKYYEWEQCD